jgi:hypothetical protein
MGVMSCSKSGCENVMCNRYSPEVGYICYECFDDLKEFQKINIGMTEYDVKEWIDKPIKRTKYFNPMINLDIFFEEC